jgi:hypothetical protein
MRDREQTLAARKALLQVRAEVERIELSQTVDQLRASLAPARAIRQILPRFINSPGKMAAAAQAVKEHPWISTVGSMLISRLPWSAVLKAGKWASAAGLAYAAWRLWKQAEPEPYARRRAAQAAYDAAAPEGGMLPPQARSEAQAFPDRVDP